MSLPFFDEVLLDIYVSRNLKKPFLGQPTIRKSELMVISGYLTQCAAVLAANYHQSPNHFLLATLFGVEDAAETLKNLNDEVWPDVKASFAAARGYEDFVMTREMREVGQTNRSQFIKDAEKAKVKEIDSCQIPNKHFSNGIALGLNDPQLVKTLYELENTSAANSPWQAARTTILGEKEARRNIPYSEFEADLKEMFLAYCESLRPKLYKHLK